MEYLQTLMENLPIVKGSDILDIIVIAFLLYKLLPVLRTTGTVRVAVLVGVLLLVTALTDALHLNTLNFVLDEVLNVGLIAIVILFQPEIRRMIDHMSNIKLKEILAAEKVESETASIISHTVRACEVMSKEKIGALIVFARHNRLDEYLKTGTIIEGQVSEQLLRNIFFPKAALHDGAMIIRDGHVTAAGCVLPLSESDRISADLGTRHRAAVGVSEASDAVVVVVSEETGAISVAINGMLKRHLAAETLEKLLRNELAPEQEPNQEKLVDKLRKALQKDDKEGNAK